MKIYYLKSVITVQFSGFYCICIIVQTSPSLELFSKLNRIFVKVKLYSLNNKSHSPSLQTLATIIPSVSEFDLSGYLI